MATNDTDIITASAEAFVIADSVVDAVRDGTPLDDVFLAKLTELRSAVRRAVALSDPRTTDAAVAAEKLKREAETAWQRTPKSATVRKEG